MENLRLSARQFALAVAALSGISCSWLGLTDAAAASRRKVFANIEGYLEQYTQVTAEGNSDSIAIIEDDIARYVRAHQEMLKETLQKGKDGYEIGLAAFAASFMRDSSVAPALGGILGNTNLDALVRRNAAGSIGVLARKKVITLDDIGSEVLLSVLGEPDQQMVVSALYAVQGLVDSPEAAPQIVEKVRGLLTHPHPQVRNEALVALASANDAESYGLISGLKTDSQPVIRKHCVIAMARLKKDAAVPDLIEFLRDSDTEVVKTAHLWLVEITGRRLGSSYELWKEQLAIWKEEKRRYYTCPLHSDTREKEGGRCKLCKRQLILKELVYSCPDHKKVQVVEAGTCPECGKELALTDTPTAPQDEYYCPDHRDVIQLEPGECPHCKTDLRKKGQNKSKSDE